MNTSISMRTRPNRWSCARTPRRFAGAMAALALVGATAHARAQCLTGGVIDLCEDPIDGHSPEATVVGGTLLSTGFRIDQKGDHVTFDLGADVVAATVRFTISNVSPSNLDHDTHLVLLATDTPTLKNPTPTRVLELKIWGDAVDASAQGITRYGVGDGVQEAEKSAGKLTWQAATTYAVDASWDNATQRLTLVRNGQTLLDFQTGDVIAGLDNTPVDMRYRYVHLAMPYLSNAAFWPVLKSVYGMVSIAATPAVSPPPSGGSSGGSGDAGSSTAAGSGGAGGAAASATVGGGGAPSPAAAVASTGSAAQAASGADYAAAASETSDAAESSRGCACSAAVGEPRSSRFIAVLVGLALLLARRRRRPRSR